VRAAFFAAALRSALERLLADERAWRAKAFGDAAECPSWRSALVAARDRLAEGA
jgi:hypothetical protein